MVGNITENSETLNGKRALKTVPSDGLAPESSSPLSESSAQLVDDEQRFLELKAFATSLSQTPFDDNQSLHSMLFKILTQTWLDEMDIENLLKTIVAMVNQVVRPEWTRLASEVVCIHFKVGETKNKIKKHETNNLNK